MKTNTLIVFMLLLTGKSLGQWLGGPVYAKNNLSAQVGTQGFGIEYFGQLPAQLGVRIGASFLPFNTSAIVQSLSHYTNDELSVKASNVRLWLDYPLFHQLFNVVVGGSYFFQATGTVSSIPNDSESTRFSFGDRQFTKEELGTLTTKVRWKGLKPYAGLSFFHNLDDQRFALTLDAGTYFLNSPKVSSSSTGALYFDETGIQTIEHNMRGYQWLPILQLGFRYSFVSNHF
ncbi:hypothetical protein SAMN05216436_101269 [bacterium A37T11]|nr:hypothetical protein SAMN05216436_101269 [bacterium A37T11]